MQAMILAAGVGSRLDPLTRNRPKALMSICNRPVMEHIVELLQRHGIHDIVVNVHYLADQIISYFGDGSAWGVRIRWVHEKELLGDAGSAKNAENMFNKSTLIILGCDDFSNIDITELLLSHAASGAIATIAATPVEDPSDYGVIITDIDGRIRRFVEKPSSCESISNLANTGIYVLEPDVFRLIPSSVPCFFNTQLLPDLLANDYRLFAYHTEEYWTNIGNVRKYRKANFDALAGLTGISIGLSELTPDTWVGDNAKIAASVRLIAPLIIGVDCRIEKEATIGPNAIIGSGCTIERGASVKDSILWGGCTIEHETRVERCVLDYGSVVYSTATIFDGLICMLPH